MVLKCNEILSLFVSLKRAIGDNCDGNNNESNDNTKDDR